MIAPVFVRRLDVVRLRMWGEKLNLLSRLSVVERGLLLCTSYNRGIVKFRNAKLVRQLRIIMARLTTLISCARKIRVLAQYARKRRWKETKPENMITLDHASPYFGYVAPHIGIGAAGLDGEQFNIYLKLKNGLLPTLASYLWFQA